MRTLLVILGVVTFLGCGGGGVEEPSPEPTPAVVPKVVMRGGIDLYGKMGLTSIEELIAASPIIVRARFNSVRPEGVRSWRSTTPGPDPQFDGYVGSLEFTFDVIEYLKGSGGAQVRAWHTATIWWVTRCRRQPSWLSRFLTPGTSVGTTGKRSCSCEEPQP